ncbi:hypothetical protein BV22DRAFT_673306 [Leucogyrophana mollusca]|uniref:Uncharacterized protein n=1 Tax=Leucogyrophana mollusca TaxID=85980 RepID=A0ACB8BBJ5_9AGAM|nr:hypothetical protein BV22DRAFT_673306 [Leucogyrophana mollusca]
MGINLSQSLIIACQYVHLRLLGFVVKPTSLTGRMLQYDNHRCAREACIAVAAYVPSGSLPQGHCHNGSAMDVQILCHSVLLGINASHYSVIPSVFFLHLDSGRILAHITQDSAEDIMRAKWAKTGILQMCG